MDRYFTSVPLAKWAFENNLTIVATMRLNRISLLNEIKTMGGGWEEKSTKYLYQKDGDALLVSYVDKKKNLGKKQTLSFQQCIQVSVLQKMSERNLMFIRFMITQKRVLMWLILYLLINLRTSNLSNGWWMP